MSIIGAALGVAGLMSQMMANKQNQSNFNEQMDMSRYQYEDAKKYNSAYQQVMRLRAAGINPAIAFGNNAGTAQTTSIPSPNPQQPVNFGGLAELVSGLMSQQAERGRTLSEERLNTIKADSQEFDLALNQMFGVRERSANLNHTLVDVSRLYQQTMLYKEQGETEKAQQTYLAFQAACADALAGVHEKERERIEKELQWYDAKAAMDLKIGRSEVSRNYASASESNASAASIRLDTAIRNAKSPYEISKAIDDALNSDIAAQIGQQNLRAARAAAEQAHYAANNKEAVFWKDYILDILGGVVDVFDVKSRLMSSKAFQSMSKSDQKRVANQAEDIAKRYELGKESNAIKRADKSVRTYKFDSKGNAKKSTQTDYRTH